MKIETKYNIGDWVYFMVITYSEGKAIGESFVKSQVDGIFIDEIKAKMDDPETSADKIEKSDSGSDKSDKK